LERLPDAGKTNLSGHGGGDSSDDDQPDRDDPHVLGDSAGCRLGACPI
jgi:hypothetical protein